MMGPHQYKAEAALALVEGADAVNEISPCWSLFAGLPVPDFDVRCPVCRAGLLSERTIIARRWLFHIRDSDSGKPGRCDVSFKCGACAAVWTHGVRVPPDVVNQWGDPSSLDWRQAQAIFARAAAQGEGDG